MPAYTLYYFNYRGRAEVCRLLFAASNTQYNDKRIEITEWDNFKSKMPCSMVPVLEIDGKTQIPQSMAIARYLAREFGFYGKNNIEMARIDYISDCVYELLDDYMRMYYDAEGKFMPEQLIDMRSKYVDIDSKLGDDILPGDKSPVEKRPGDKSPVDKRPGDKSPVDKRPGDKSPVDKRPGDKSPVDKRPGDKSLVDVRPEDKDAKGGEVSDDSRMLGLRWRYNETCNRVLPFLEKTLEMYNNGNQYFMGDTMTLADMVFHSALESPMQENTNLLSRYPKLTSLNSRISSHQKLSSYLSDRFLSDF